MRLKRFIFFSLIFIVGISGYVFSITDETFGAELPWSGTILALPVAVWIVLPSVVLFLGTLAYLIYHKSSSYFQNKKWTKDQDSIEHYLSERAFGKRCEIEFKTEQYKSLQAMLNRFDLYPNGSSESGVESLDSAVNKIMEIYQGKYVDIKSLKLDKENKIRIKNIENRLKSEEGYYATVLKKHNDYSSEVVGAAAVIAAQKEIGLLKKWIEQIALDSKYTKGIFAALSNLDDFEDEEIKKLCVKTAFRSDDYLDLAMDLKGKISPSRIVKLFELLCESDHNAESALLYVYFELEMIDSAKERLQNNDEKELLRFKAYLALRESGKHFPVEIFL